MSHFPSKLEMIQLCEEGLLTPKTGQKLGLLCQKVGPVMTAKETFSKDIPSATPVNT